MTGLALMHIHYGMELNRDGLIKYISKTAVFFCFIACYNFIFYINIGSPPCKILDMP